MISIVDYGLGNIQAFLNVYKRLNIPAKAVRSVDELGDPEKLILPGVGAFDHAMELLTASGMRERLDDLVVHRKVPVLGICVGMQILAGSSDEGKASGLNWVPGTVKSFKALHKPEMLLPHMGWNDVVPVPQSTLFRELEENARFYFLHSYYFQCDRSVDICAKSNYGVDFACAVTVGNVHGVQFHPEKSHHFGTQLLKNFAEL